MPNSEHLALLLSPEWNAWRSRNTNVTPDLTDANLSGANLAGRDLRRADLSRANLSGAKIDGADMTRWSSKMANWYLKASPSSGKCSRVS